MHSKMIKTTSTYNPKQPHILIEGATQFELGTFDGKSIAYDFPKILKYLDAKGKILLVKILKSTKRITSYYLS